MGERVIMMPDKIVRTGSAPVYDEKNEVIANIHYFYLSFKRRIEITDKYDQVISKGNIKYFSWRPTWLIFNQEEENIASIKKLFTLFSNNFIYRNNLGEMYQIEGNFRARNFTILKNGQIIIEVQSTTEFFTLHPHSYLVRIIDEEIDTYEVINIVEGIRSLVECSGGNSSVQINT